MRCDAITVQHEASNLAFGMALWLCEGIKAPYRNIHWLHVSTGSFEKFKRLGIRNAGVTLLLIYYLKLTWSSSILH